MHKLAAAILLATSGCSFIPRHERPAAPISSSFAEGPGSGIAAADRGWRDVFTDQRLQALIALALANNRDLRVAILNVEVARATHRIERSALLPNVGATGGVEVSGNRDSATTRYSVGLGVTSYELDLFGRVRSLKAAALEEYLASEATRRAAHLSLISEVVAQYLRERAFAEQLQLAQQTLATVTESQAITTRLFEAGQRSELDVSSAVTQVETARAEIARLTRLRAQAENALVVLVGGPLPAGLPAPLALEAQSIPTDIPAGLPSELLQRRPDIIAAEHVLRSANANIGAARAAFFPSISLTGFAGLASGALSSLFTGGAFVWSVAPQLSVPIFTGGRNQANLDIARVRKRIEIARYEQTIQIAFREAADALIGRQTYEAQLTAQVARVAAEQTRYRISQDRYTTGIESYFAVLTAQQDLYVAQQQLIEVRLARLINLADLYRALGGGWRERS